MSDFINRFNKIEDKLDSHLNNANANAGQIQKLNDILDDLMSLNGKNRRRSLENWLHHLHMFDSKFAKMIEFITPIIEDDMKAFSSMLVMTETNKAMAVFRAGENKYQKEFADLTHIFTDDEITGRTVFEITMPITVDADRFQKFQQSQTYAQPEVQQSQTYAQPEAQQSGDRTSSWVL